MATFTQAPAGTVCWIELHTSDVEGAKKFYGSVFGWKYKDLPIGPGGTYHIPQLNGVDVGGTYKLMPEAAKMGMPSNWLTYFAVPNVDEAAKKASSLGGKVMREPMDVMDVGRMAVIQDPAGAAFAVWTAKGSGNTMRDEPGSFGWAQLNSTDTAKATKFYTQLFGWRPQVDPMPGGGGDYTTWMVGQTMAGGMMAMPPDAGPIPSHWLVYLATSDVDATHAKATAAGAQSYVAPADIPDIGRFSVLADPQGASFALVRFNKRG
jgi:predicted enzyme related to lactoylglutathione lyase